MNDELRECANCHHSHKWGILGYSQDGVPLYGTKSCDCHCDRFVAGDLNLPALPEKEVKELWAQTSFLNAQVPLATRIVVRKIMESGKNWFGVTKMEKQWPEFVGFMISQLTDIRGAMVRDESKFAHLVAHTDEIVEAMRGVAQLKERLDNIYAIQERILQKLELKESAAMFDSKSAPLWNEPIVTDGEPADD